MAEMRRHTNQLLHNILPTYVAKYFLEQDRQAEVRNNHVHALFIGCLLLHHNTAKINCCIIASISMPGFNCSRRHGHILIPSLSRKKP